MAYNTLQVCKQQLLDRNMNPFVVADWEQLVLSENFDLAQYNELVFTLAYNLENQYGYAKKKSSVSFLDAIEAAIYKYLTDCNTLGKLDVLSTLGVDSLVDSTQIARLIEAVAAKTGIAVPIINLFSTLVIIGMLKLGTSAWCKYYEMKQASDEDN